LYVFAAIAGPYLWSSSGQHTRFTRDWTSDVFSSDLELEAAGVALDTVIISRVLADHGIQSVACSFQLGVDYPERDYCTQYDETSSAERRSGNERSFQGPPTQTQMS